MTGALGVLSSAFFLAFVVKGEKPRRLLTAVTGLGVSEPLLEGVVGELRLGMVLCSEIIFLCVCGCCWCSPSGRYFSLLIIMF